MAARSSEHELRDGTRVLVRPLLPSDRDELVRGFEGLSDAARRLRFLSAVEHLTTEAIDYLITLDYDDHFAWAAFDVGRPESPGIGVARYIRDPERPTEAEAAVTVVDEYQGRGLGALLLLLLAEEAQRHGITTFVAYVLWDNREVLAGLTAVGARVSAQEPGIARVELDLPEPEERPSIARRLLHELRAARNSCRRRRRRASRRGRHRWSRRRRPRPRWPRSSWSPSPAAEFGSKSAATRHPPTQSRFRPVLGPKTLTVLEYNAVGGSGVLTPARGSSLRPRSPDNSCRSRSTRSTP